MHANADLIGKFVRFKLSIRLNRSSISAFYFLNIEHIEHSFKLFISWLALRATISSFFAILKTIYIV